MYQLISCILDRKFLPRINIRLKHVLNIKVSPVKHKLAMLIKRTCIAIEIRYITSFTQNNIRKLRKYVHFL